MSGEPIVNPGVLDAIQAHVDSARPRKVGGILLGRPAGDTVNVQDALPARQIEEHAGEIAFPGQVWEDAYAALDRFPGAGIVGWYHSHPGSGVAMSEYDRRLHTTLFGEPHNLALVLDPVAQTMAWYGWTISSLSSAESPSPPVGTMAAAAPAGPKRAAVAALVVLGMTAAGAGGYWLSDRRGDRGGAAVSEQVRSLSGRLQRQQASNERVRATLDQARQAVAEEAGRLQQLQGELDTARRDLQEAHRELRQARHAVPRTFVLRYRVQPGDSLWELARTFYGDPSQWTRILDANRDRIRDPDRLAIGQILKIPLTA